MLAAPDAHLLERLAQITGQNGVRPASAADLEDPRGQFRGQAAAVVRPADALQVAAVLRECAQARVAVVPRAGGTGLVGGSLLPEGPAPVLLSLDRISRIAPVPGDANLLRAGAGAVLADVQRAAESLGRLFPLSLASGGSATIGGVLATNAGGVNVLRYGNARDLCLGLRVVFADGSIWDGLSGLRKDNTGYDLRNLIIGSEGTLGIITEATLRLHPRPKTQVSAWISLPDPAAGLALLDHLSGALGPIVSAFELIDRTGLDFLCETGLIPELPFAPTRWSALADVGGGPDAPEALQEALASALEAGLLSDAQISQSDAQRARLWQIRETIPAANRRIGAVSSHDISLPTGQVPAFVAQAGSAIAALDARLRINCFGHLGDGNLHYNVFPPQGGSRADWAALAPDLRRMVYDRVVQMGGSFSAEHGIGRLKLAEMARYGDPARLAAMRAIKRALDPLGILNPGAVVAEQGRA